VSIAILDYGMGNLRSVSRALSHVGADAEVTADPHALAGADAVVVPGVGRFGACMRNLAPVAEAVRTVARDGRPLFGVCLGLQVLFDGSEEDEQAGLGILPGRARRLAEGADVKVPHMGWNGVRWTARHPFVDGIPTGTRFYFVHSYAVDLDAVLTVGATEHGRPFSSVVGRGNVFATQFHPEKSGEAGLAIYERFVRAVRA
jgi:imidazole glycerol-phosphate synthase subunit HisH